MRILFVNHTRFGAAVIFIVACFPVHSLRPNVCVCVLDAMR